MKKTLVIVLGICLVAMFAGTVSARDIDRGGKSVMKDLNGTGLLNDDSVPGFYEAAAVDTYQIVRYSFEVDNMMNWTKVDFTQQQDIYYHVDDFVGIAPGDFGGLLPLGGAQSMWCGTRPGTDEYMCGWETAPGYGNLWNQHFESNEITVIATVNIAYSIAYDCEGGGYDDVYVDYLDASSDWINVKTWGGYGSLRDTVTLAVAETGATTKFRFHFTADGAWSDQDGNYNTDGAVILDDIIVTADAVILDTEDFEAATVGDHSTAFWTGFGEPPYGNYGALMTGLMEPDPCHDEYGTQWAFLEGSTELSSRQDLYPGMYVTPRCLNGAGLEAPCQNEGILSPKIIMTKHSTANNNVQDADIPVGDQTLFGGVLFRYQCYRDLPLDNLIFYTWGVRNIKNDCPLAWKDRNYVYYGPDQDYLFAGEDVSAFLTSPNDTMQLTFGVADMADVWAGYYGTGTNHSPSPWFDNVYVQRVRTSGPQWAYRTIDLFQDNFPPNADPTGFVRADMANDITETAELVRIDPGDSVVVIVTSPTSDGIAGVTDGYEDGIETAEVYMHFKVDAVLAGKVAADFAATVDTCESHTPMALPIPTGPDGNGWFKVQARSAVAGSNGTMAVDKFMFDLNDGLFTYNHVIEYYFSALDQNAETNYLPTNALAGGAFEWTCLPSRPYVFSILYVDDFDGRGSWDGEVQNYMDPALTAVSNTVWDRYDMNAPSSNVANGLASRINADRLGMFYEKIIWDSGDLNSGTITNGVDDKSEDCALLETWANDEAAEGAREHATNLLVMGDGVVDNLTDVGAVTFLTNTLGARFEPTTTPDSYYETTGGYTGGGVISPLITPVALGVFDGLEPFYVFGGCPIINSFDVLDVNNPKAAGALTYPNASFAAIALDDSTNGNVATKRAVTTGFSFMAIRDANSVGPPVRNEFLKTVFEFFENGVNGNITGAEDQGPAPTKLVGNFPNPFNPMTKIEFDMRAKGHVSILVYDVAGRLVKTLVNDVRNAGSYSKTWNGINNRGASVASGVYFYRMDTKDYSQTRKMILLR